MRALRFLRPTGRRETGASSIEYGLIAVLIAAIIVFAVAALGSTTTEVLGEPCDSLAASGSATTCS